ncbi:MAG: transglycosylase domain-containing protein, partial [Mailhella sp.]|nr:transglycosylase domain-containing protein [Mailhella sp.]
VEAAARTYFGKHASELSIAECAMIAGLPQSPSTHNPYRHPEAAKKRQEHVLRRMRDLGWITDEEFEKAFYEELKFSSMPSFMGREGGWYLEEVRRQLIDLFTEEFSAELGFDLGVYGEDLVYEQGLTVYTSMEPVQQVLADKAFRRGLEEAAKRQGYEGALAQVSINDVSAFFEENPFDIDKFKQGEWQKAVVLETEKAGAVVRLGEYEGFLSVDTMGWARKPHKAYNGRFTANAIKDARDALSKGDVVWVSLNLPAQKELDKLKKNNPRNLALEEAELVAEKVLPVALQQYPRVQGAMIALEPKTGDVVAMVGGYEFSYDGDQFNRATQAKRQPGSAFKPFVYSAALDAGFTAGSMTLDAPIMIIDTFANNVWRPQNFGGKFDGPLRFNKALARSRNLSTIRIAQEIGMDTVLERASQMKLAREYPLPTLAVSLGAIEVLPIDVVCSYSAFANLGKRPNPRFIQKIVGPFGNTLYETEPELEEVITPQNAYIMSQLLEGVIQYGTATALKEIDRPLAGKTGTTNNEVDAWFVGLTPELVTAAYVGFDQIEPMGRGETGTGAALPIYKYFAEEVLQYYPPTDFEQPENIYFRTVDGISLPFVVGTTLETGINAVQPDNVTESDSAEELLMQGFDM